MLGVLGRGCRGGRFFSLTGVGTMAKDQGAERKYGRDNFTVAMDGDDIVVRIDSKSIALNTDETPKIAGSPNLGVKDHPPRVLDLVGTSGGFERVGGCKVSCNVTRG